MNQLNQKSYYYLNSHLASPVGQVKTKTIMNDLNRGVTRLTEDAYCKNYGASITSIRFMIALMNIIGHNGMQGVRAELKTANNRSTLTVKTSSNLTIVFLGVSGGYFGEGSKSCHDILKAFGFNEKQSNKPFERDNFLVTRKVTNI